MRWLIRSLPVVVLLLAACGTQERVADTLQVRTASPTCTAPSPCWMTAGGTKFDSATGLDNLAQNGPRVSFGGNVAPGCDLDPGQGGQWNHVDHAAKLHFQGFAITTVSCDGVPTGSPDVEVNHITFSGTGRLEGFASNSAYSVENVCFTAQAWDWAEPGSKGQPDPTLVDQYFIRVTDCGSTTLLSLGTETVPVSITGGNVQIHPCN